MKKHNQNTPALKLLYIVSSIFLSVSVIAFVALGFLVQYQDLRDTYCLAEDAVSFLESECEKYDNYTRGNAAQSMQNLLDMATELKSFVSYDRLTDPEFLYNFSHTAHVGGILILDDKLSVLAQTDIDHKDACALWSATISTPAVKDIIQHPQKTYINHTVLEHIPYDYAVTARDDSSLLILCYSSTIKPSTDPYELTIKNALENSSFHKNPTLIITNAAQVLSTNNALVNELTPEECDALCSASNWSADKLTKIDYKNNTWYGLHRVYGNYNLYAIYPSNETFSSRTNYIIFILMAYMILCIALLAIQRHFDKVSLHRMQKQLGIINAISTGYSSTFLLHLRTMELEPVNPSARLLAVYEKHPDPYDFLLAVCKNEVALKYYSQTMHFLDLDTIAARAKGQNFLGFEIQDVRNTWYSVLLIPQESDADGNVTALLITTRDVTSLKQTEELSFKDKLTGLYNRNYMESKSASFVSDGDFPVSLIMADCNYLKRTNDTLGHEYGDLLLQHVANTIKEVIPSNCIAMRVGGDEFVLLCTQCDHAQAQELIAQIRKRLAARSTDKLTLSVSFGISTTDRGEFSFSQAYEAADQEMYLDKQAAHIKR